jgi:hypothetical protein
MIHNPLRTTNSAFITRDALVAPSGTSPDRHDDNRVIVLLVVNPFLAVPACLDLSTDVKHHNAEGDLHLSRLESLGGRICGRDLQSWRSS